MFGCVCVAHIGWFSSPTFPSSCCVKAHPSWSVCGLCFPFIFYFALATEPLQPPLAYDQSLLVCCLDIEWNMHTAHVGVVQSLPCFLCRSCVRCVLPPATTQPARNAWENDIMNKESALFWSWDFLLLKQTLPRRTGPAFFDSSGSVRPLPSGGGHAALVWCAPAHESWI